MLFRSLPRAAVVAARDGHQGTALITAHRQARGGAADAADHHDALARAVRQHDFIADVFSDVRALDVLAMKLLTDSKMCPACSAARGVGKLLAISMINSESMPAHSGWDPALRRIYRCR